MDIQVSEELKSFLLLEDLEDDHPANHPRVPIARSTISNLTTDLPETRVMQFCGIRSWLVAPEQRDLAIERLVFEYGTPDGRDYFDGEGVYHSGEVIEDRGVWLEVIVHDRHFEGLDLSYFEPTDRLVRYLQLHRDGSSWVDPRHATAIIKSAGTSKGYEPHDTNLTIVKASLLDYLAARSKGLLVLKYCDRNVFTPHTLVDAPQPLRDRPTAHGYKTWAEIHAVRGGEHRFICRLWEAFWIDPGLKASRRPPDPGDVSEIPFTTADGASAVFSTTRERLETLSFAPAMLRALQAAGGSVRFESISTLTLRFPTVDQLSACVNSEGQIQAFFGDVDRLDTDCQRFLAGFSQAERAGMSREFFRNNIAGQFTTTRPLTWTLGTCLQQVNAPWLDRYSEALLLSPAQDAIPALLAAGPVTSDWAELADLMLELQKVLIPESPVARIASGLDLRQLADKGTEYDKIRSIGYLRLLFRTESDPRLHDGSAIVNTIRELRNAKGHPADVHDVLTRAGLPTTSPRDAFLQIMIRLVDFLLEFKAITETRLGAIAGPSECWEHIEKARDYFRSPE